MDTRIKKAITQIGLDMGELIINPDETKKQMFLGMGFALGRIYEAETGIDMRIVGPKVVMEWAANQGQRKDLN